VLRRVVIAVGCLALASQATLVALRPTHYQWDFRSYYFGAKLALAARDPYDVGLMAKTMAENGLNDGKVFPFIYPPHALLEFAPLALVPFTVAYYVYLAIEIIALCIILVVGASWLDGWWRAAWPLLVSLMFGGTDGMRDGNLGLVEAALVMLAIVALTRGRPGSFGGLVAVASSWKLALVPVCSLALAGRSRSALRGVVIPLSAIATLLLADRLLRPDLWIKFRETTAGHLVEDVLHGRRGHLNSSSLRLLSDVSRIALGDVTPVIVVGTYVVLTLVVAAITIVIVVRRPQVPLLPVCLYGLLAYGLVVPRLVPYSLVLLIAPAVYVLSKCMRTWSGVTVAVFSCIPFFYLGRLAGRPDDAPVSSFLLLPVEYADWLTLTICWIVMTHALIRKPFIFENEVESSISRTAALNA
jgi:alpha-1,2-mannosyltransferase